MIVEFSEDARADYSSAIGWYSKKSTQLALKFDAELNDAIEEIKRFPDRFPFEEADVRLYILSSFPYGVYYRYANDTIRVIGIYHHSRNTNPLKRRV